MELAHLQAELCLLKHRGGECETDHPDLDKFRGFSAQDFDRYFSIFSQRCPLLGRDVRNTGENRLKSENVSFSNCAKCIIFIFYWIDQVFSFTSFPSFFGQVFLLPL